MQGLGAWGVTLLLMGLCGGGGRSLERWGSGSWGKGGGLCRSLWGWGCGSSDWAMGHGADRGFLWLREQPVTQGERFVGGFFSVLPS